MINLFPEPKMLREQDGYTKAFQALAIDFGNLSEAEKSDLLEIAQMRFWNCKDVKIFADISNQECITINSIQSLSGIETSNRDLFIKQGYSLKIEKDRIILRYQEKSGFIYAITTIKQLLIKREEMYLLPLCEITDWPSIEHRAVAPTFSWYAGYGRLGFDMQPVSYTHLTLPTIYPA